MVPTLTTFETEGIFLNFEGKPQNTFKSILNSNKHVVSLDFCLSFFLSKYPNSNQQKGLMSPFAFFNEKSDIFFPMSNHVSLFNCWYNQNLNFFRKYPLKSSFEDFYQTDSFTKNSLNMFKRSKEIRKISTNFFTSN
jgi:hypothetical protein